MNAKQSRSQNAGLPHSQSKGFYVASSGKATCIDISGARIIEPDNVSTGILKPFLSAFAAILPRPQTA